MEATNAIVNAIETINATVDQLVQQGNELCDDVDNLRAEDERMGKDIADLRSDGEAIRADLAGLHSSLAADKEHISANKEAIEANKGTIAAQSVAIQLNKEVIEALGARVANIEQQLNMIARLQNELADSLLKLTETRATPVEASKDVAQTDVAQTDVVQTDGAQTDGAQTDVAQTDATSGMAALIARIPKPDAVRTRATAQAPAPVVEATVVQKDAAVPKPAAKTVPRTQATTNAVETRAYARQYMIENGAKVEQLRDPAAIEATVKSDAFAAWLAAR